MGDWNAVRISDERCGSVFCSQDAYFFNEFVDHNDLFEVPLGGLNFTWWNKSGRLIFPRGFSDHSPLILFQDKVDFRPTYFKIFDSWFDRHDFDDTVKIVWDSISVDSNLDIVAKFRLLKGHLKNWIHNTRSNEAKRLKEITSKIDELDIIIDSGYATNSEIDTRNTLSSEKNDLLKIIDLDSLQKAIVKW
ncbi:uncharacterized protein [Rutidosis leptorrhynchoides]|uniref:uncharacterized protein n=1 Tax=Rutidosis leptorrhynchoides TaxID=125765 RepID=UPI003A9944C9